MPHNEKPHGENQMEKPDVQRGNWKKKGGGTWKVLDEVKVETVLT